MVSARRGTRTNPKLRWAGVTTAIVLVAVGCSHKTPSATSGSTLSQAPQHPASPSPSPPPPPICPLTGTLSPSGVPNRPALAIKVENAPESRPPAGLDAADVVFEEPVEGGITRFVAVFQCHDASRVEPVRSARQADPYLVNQMGKTLYGSAGGSPPTEESISAAIRAGWLVDVGYSNGPGYHRDSRPNPHNLYTSTSEVYARPEAKTGSVPNAIFSYAATPAPGAPAASIHVNFSQYADVTWRWNASAGLYQRYYGGVPANLAGGGIISAPNIIVQDVAVTMSWWIEDPSGSHQPIPNVQGSGQALVCRQGTCVTGTWHRPGLGLSQFTHYYDPAGKEIALVPGNTWVELAPTSVAGPGPIPVGAVSVAAQ